MDVKFLLFVLFIQFVNSAYLNKKSCPNKHFMWWAFLPVTPMKAKPIRYYAVANKLVNPKKCDIHNVKMDPCLDSPAFCVLTREEPYTIAFDFTPHFDARNLRVSMLSDPDNSTRFTTTVTPVSDACEYTKCPVENNLRSVFELDFEYYMKSQGQFPLLLRLWHDGDESETCCFTIDVKMLN